MKPGFFHRSASAVSLLGDYDTLDIDTQRTWGEKDTLPLPRPMPRRRNFLRKAVAGIIAGAAMSMLLLNSYGGPRTMREEVQSIRWHSSQAQSNAPPVRKALVSAGVIGNNFTWLQDVPEDWEVYKYISDDPFAEYTVPRAQGREAMVYLTYIIDHYHDLPDYIVFVHGHERGWHQPEPVPLILQALNLKALDDLDWVSLRCQNFPGCTPDYTHLWPKKVGIGGNPDWIGQVFTGLHSFVYRPEDPWYEEEPDTLAAACCAQFAVSKKAAMSKPLEYWERLRAPILRDVPEFVEEWGAGEEYTTDWHLGVAYERGWHWFFGKPAQTCYSHDFCRNTIFSNKIHCDGITTDWPNSQWYENITCTYGDAPPRIVSEELVFEMTMSEEGPHGGPHAAEVLLQDKAAAEAAKATEDADEADEGTEEEGNSGDSASGSIRRRDADGEGLSS